MDADLRRRSRRAPIGAIAVAPSRPDTHLRRQRRGPAAARPLRRRRHVQVRPTRASTWTNIGLRDAQQIALDRRRSDGRRTACSSRCSATRTARTRSAGSSGRRTAAKTWEKVLYKDENTGGCGRRVRPDEPERRLRRRSGRRGRARGRTGSGRGPSSGLFKSTDGGTTWRADSARACPASPRDCGRIGFGDRARGPEADLRDRRRPAADKSQAASSSRTTRARRSRRVNGEMRALGPRRRTSPRSRSIRRTPDVVYVANTSRLPVDGRRQDVRACAGRAGRRRLPHDLDQPREPRHHPARGRSGRRRHRERRRDVEHLVQPADRAVLPRHPPTTVSRTASTAASRRAARRASRAAATTARSRSATGIRSAPRSTATSRPIRSIPTSSTAASSRGYRHSTTGRVQDVAPGAASRGNYRVRAHAAGRLLAGRPARSSSTPATSS